jgi:hypothetical protein
MVCLETFTSTTIERTIERQAQKGVQGDDEENNGIPRSAAFWRYSTRTPGGASCSAERAAEVYPGRSHCMLEEVH